MTLTFRDLYITMYTRFKGSHLYVFTGWIIEYTFNTFYICAWKLTVIQRLFPPNEIERNEVNAADLCLKMSLLSVKYKVYYQKTVLGVYFMIHEIKI